MEEDVKAAERELAEVRGIIETFGQLKKDIEHAEEHAVGNDPCAKDHARLVAWLKHYKECIDALSFYADPENYFAIAFLPDPPCGAFMEDFDETYLGVKPGKLARETINKLADLKF